MSRILVLLSFVLAASPAWGYLESYPGCHARAFGATKSLAVAPNGDPIVTGCVHGGYTDAFHTVRYSRATGAVVWSARYFSAAQYDARATSIAIDPAGDVVVTGSSRDYVAGSPRQVMRTVKYNGETGAEMWSAAFGANNGPSVANAIAVSPAGDVFITGESDDDAVSGRNIRTVKYDGATGRQRWTASFNGTFGGFDIGQAIAVDANGDAYVTGLSGETVGGSNFRTLKYDGQTGAQLWTHQIGANGDDSGLDAAIDPEGNVVVAGYTYEQGSGADYRVVKLDAASGAVRWTTTVASNPIAADTGESIGIDASGNVFVTGFTDNAAGQRMMTAKLAASNGAILWTALTDRGSEYAYSLAVDANGDVAITGSSRPPSGPGSDIRTLKYRGDSGALLWSSITPSDGGATGVGFDPEGDALVAGYAGSADGSRYGYKVVKYAGTSGTQLWLSELSLANAAPSSPGSLSGLWWNPAESGWGIHFTQRRNIIFAAWFTYDAAGKPKWYVASRCELPAAQASGACEGPLYEVNGPTFFGPPFDPADVHAAQAGTLQLSFNNSNAGSMTYTVSGQSRTVAIQRQELPVGPTPAAVDFTDLWWNPAESGWGMGISHRDSTMFLAWYVYDAAGKPTWLVASNCQATATTCSGTLYRTTGPAFGPGFDPSQVHVAEAGTIGITVLDANTLRLSYTVDGIPGGKIVTRQLF